MDRELEIMLDKLYIIISRNVLCREWHRWDDRNSITRYKLRINTCWKDLKVLYITDLSLYLI
jgi:hypothetical protein